MEIIIWILSFAFAVSIHESAHALAAYWLGDPTAKHQGRISLNPLKHIDPFGLLFLIIAHFGWAKPVPVNDKNFDHPKLYMAMTAAAGPLSNVLLALGSLWIMQFVPTTAAFTAFFDFLQIFFLLNLFLTVFNLLPLFPLDGEKIIALFVPRRYQYEYEKFASHGPLILFGLIGLSFVFDWNLLSKVLIPMAQYLGTFLEFLVYM